MTAARSAAAALVVAVLVLPACGAAARTIPRCEPSQRLAIVAQSVPGAAYVPCIDELPPGWSFESFEVDDDGTTFSLRSDRSDAPVDVALSPRCDIGSASPVAARDEGVRTYQAADSISPHYAGRFYDVFPRGCVTYEFDFERGPHVALVDDLLRAVQLYPRRQLRQELEDELGLTLDP